VLPGVRKWGESETQHPAHDLYLASPPRRSRPRRPSRSIRGEKKSRISRPISGRIERRSGGSRSASEISTSFLAAVGTAPARHVQVSFPPRGFVSLTIYGPDLRSLGPLSHDNVSRDLSAREISIFIWDFHPFPFARESADRATGVLFSKCLGTGGGGGEGGGRRSDSTREKRKRRRKRRRGDGHY